MRKVLTKNLGLKIWAVVLSVVLWLFVTSRGQSEISLEMPIEYKNIPAELGIVSNQTKTVIVTIRGQERLLKNVKPSDIRVAVDLGKAKQGEGTYYIRSEDIRLPYAISVSKVSPSSVKLTLEEIVAKPVRVKPVISGFPAPGFRVQSVAADPYSVTVRGLKSEVRRVGHLKTESLDITGLDETTEQELGIDTAGLNVRPDRDTVKVKVVISGRKR